MKSDQHTGFDCRMKSDQHTGFDCRTNMLVTRFALFTDPHFFWQGFVWRMKSADEPRSKRRRLCKQWNRSFGHKLSEEEYKTLLALRRLVGGSVQYLAEAANMKMGAAGFEELSAWPDIMIADLKQLPLG